LSLAARHRVGMLAVLRVGHANQMPITLDHAFALARARIV
jgi:hypothetical protein